MDLRKRNERAICGRHAAAWVLYGCFLLLRNAGYASVSSIVAVYAAMVPLFYLFYHLFTRHLRRVRVEAFLRMALLYMVLIQLLAYGYAYTLLPAIGVVLQRPDVDFSLVEFMVTVLQYSVHIATFAFLAFLLERNAHHIRRRVSAWGIQKKNELAATVHQLSPHLGYGILNKLYKNALAQDPELPQGILRLADLSAYMASASALQGRLVPLRKELDMLMLLYQMLLPRSPHRDGSWISIQGNPDTYKVPPLALLDLLENAIKYTAAQDRERIILAIGCGKSTLRCHIRNPSADRDGHEQSNLSGNRALRRRLHLLFGDRARLRTRLIGREFHAILDIEGAVWDAGGEGFADKRASILMKYPHRPRRGQYE